MTTRGKQAMPRYIDADALLKELLSCRISGMSEFNAGIADARKAVRKMLTTDIEEVRHGEWIPLKQKKHWADTEIISTDIVGFCCSECGAEEKFKYRYCHCGAKMDGKDK